MTVYVRGANGGRRIRRSQGKELSRLFESCLIYDLCLRHVQIKTVFDFARLLIKAVPNGEKIPVNGVTDLNVDLGMFKK